MKNKLKYLIKINLNKKIKTKAFRIINVVLLILIVAVANLGSIIKSFGGDFDSKRNLYVIGEKGVYDSFSLTYNAYAKSTNLDNYEVSLSNKTVDELKKDLNDKNNDVIIVLDATNGVLTAELISYDNISAIFNQVLSLTLDGVKKDIYLDYSGLSLNEKMELNTPVEITRTFVNEDIDDLASSKEKLGAVLIPIFIIPFFILVVLLVQSVGADINEEKTTRGMEIIISSVPPKVHFFSKIIGATSFVLMQGVLILLYGGIGLFVNKLIGGGNISSIAEGVNGILEVLKAYGVTANIVPAIILTLILFVLSFVAYALIAGILASMTTSIEDYQQMQGPLMIICVIGYYIAIMAGTFPGSSFITIMSYVPFMSSMISPVLFLLGQIGLIDMIISIIVLSITIFLLFKYGLKVYKVGILNYSSKDLWKKVLKSIKE